VVFKAFDSELNRPVAVKVLAPHLAGSGAARKRFAREARAAAAIVHEHVVAIHNVESEHEPPFLVMQYVAGESLQVRLDREGPLGVREILRIARQTAAGLAAAHEQGLVHRDVKPANVLLEEGIDRALLTDFGLARASDDASLTHSGHIPGTPHYMSPEQARGESADRRSDLFSLGSVMYAMCTGHSPFRAETSYGVLRRITDSQPRSIREANPEIPLWLCRIIEKIHAKARGERYESAAEVADVLGHCLAHVQHPATNPLPASVVALTRSSSAATAVWKLLRRQPLNALACAVSSIVLLMAAAMLMPRQEADPRAVFESPPGQSEQPGESNSALSIDLGSGSTADWDSTQREVSELAEQAEEFAARTNRLWDEIPVPSQLRNDIESSPPDGTAHEEPFQ
jgi:serine/threonine protein kinase